MRPWHFALAAPWLLLLTACASAPQDTKTVRVEVPVPVPCVVDAGPRFEQPDTAEAIKAAPNVAGRVDLLLAGQIQRERWIAALEAAEAACRAP